MYKGCNLYQAYCDFMFPVVMREYGFDYLANTNDLQPSDLSLHETLYDDGIVYRFMDMCDNNDWHFVEALFGWEDHKHWHLHTDDWHYLCKNRNDDHHDSDGWFTFPADMLFWYKDGFYCESCLDDFSVSLHRRGRSLHEELVLAKKRGKCYRTLPQPVIFANEWDYLY